MSKMLKKIYDADGLDFRKCGKIIVAPRQNIYAFSCSYCCKLFTQMPAFMRHLRREHTQIFSGSAHTSHGRFKQIKKDFQHPIQPQNVYTVEELLQIDNEKDKQKPQQQATVAEQCSQIEDLQEACDTVKDTASDDELQQEIEELLKSINVQRKDSIECNEVSENMEICSSMVDEVTTSCEEVVVHIEVDDTDDEFEPVQPIEIELNDEDTQCYSTTDILPSTPIDVEQQLEPYFIVDVNDELLVMDYTCKKEHAQIKNNITKPLNPQSCEYNMPSSIENRSKNKQHDVNILDDIKIPSNMSLLKELLTSSLPNKIESENHIIDKVNYAPLNLEKLSFANNVQQKELKNQVPVAVVQANNFCEKVSLMKNDERIANDVEKLQLPLRKRILSSNIADVDLKRSKILVDKEQDLKENKVSQILLNFTSETEQNAVTAVKENGLDFLQDGVTIFRVNLTDAQQDELKAENLSSQVAQTTNEADVAYMSNDTHNQLKILIKIEQEDTIVGGNSSQMMQEYFEVGKTELGNANVEQLTLHIPTKTEREEQGNAYQRDFQLLCKVGLNSILDPDMDDKLPLQEKQEIRDKASKFASIFVNFRHIWEVKSSAKCNQQLDKEFAQLTRQTNDSFDEKLITKQLKRMINLISLWHKRCNQQYIMRKMPTPERIWYFMQIFSFLPKSLRCIFYCEECAKYFRSEIKYDKHRFWHTDAFRGFYCQYCHKVFSGWQILRIHERKCRSYNCLVCGLKCLKAEGQKNRKLCDQCGKFKSCITTKSTT